MLNQQQLAAIARQRMNAEFSVPFNRILDEVDRLRMSQATPAEVFRTLGQLQAAAMVASADIIWNAAKTVFADSQLRYQTRIEHQLTAFVLSFVPQLRKQIEEYCRGVITSTPSSDAAAAWVALTNSLNRNEQAVRDILQSRVLEYAKELYLALQGQQMEKQPVGRRAAAVSNVKPLPHAGAADSSVTEAAEFLDLDLRPAPRPVPEPASRSALATKRVFVVHGHDDRWRELLTAHLTRLGCDPIVLREHAERGQTIIEKFEQYSDVSFAVVLVTADDEGRVRGGATEPQPRARQNVILELGYFIGKLGRDKVCMVTGDSVELPSDFTGVLNIPLDNNGFWKQRLARELLAAGFTIEPSKLLL